MRWHQRPHTFLAAVAVAVALSACSHSRKVEPDTVPSPSVSQSGAPDGGPDGRGPGGPGGRRGGPGGMRGDGMMMRNITLTDAQRTQVDSIRARYREQMRSLDPRNNADDRTKMMDLMTRQSAEVRAVLTPDQQTVYDQNMADMRSRMQQRGDRNGPPGTPPAR